MRVCGGPNRASRAVSPNSMHVFGRVSASNPFLGSVQHAPPSDTNFRDGFNSEVVSNDEEKELKASRHNPITGIFHASPNGFNSKVTPPQRSASTTDALLTHSLRAADKKLNSRLWDKQREAVKSGAAAARSRRHDSAPAVMAPLDSDKYCKIFRLRGHLFDTNFINEAKGMVSRRGAEFHVLELDHEEDEHAKSSIVVSLEASAASRLEKIDLHLRELANTMPNAQAKVEELEERQGKLLPRARSSSVSKPSSFSAPLKATKRVANEAATHFRIRRKDHARSKTFGIRSPVSPDGRVSRTRRLSHTYKTRRRSTSSPNKTLEDLAAIASLAPMRRVLATQPPDIFGRGLQRNDEEEIAENLNPWIIHNTKRVYDAYELGGSPKVLGQGAYATVPGIVVERGVPRRQMIRHHRTLCTSHLLLLTVTGFRVTQGWAVKCPAKGNSVSK